MKKSQKKPNEPIYVNVPANFDALALARLHRNNEKNALLLADRLNWFVHQLMAAPLKQDVRKTLEETGYINLSTKAFDLVYRSRTTTEEVIKILVSTAVERSDSYQVNNYSKGYRLKPEYFVSADRWIEISSPSMKKYVNEIYNQRKQEQKELMLPIEQLNSFITDQGLQIDKTGAHNFMEFWISDLKEKIKTKCTNMDPNLVAELLNRAVARVYYQKKQIERISDNPRKSGYRDSSGQRLHSVFTSLKSPLRSFLKYKGQKLVSVDLKASQPYLLNLLLKPEFFINPTGVEFSNVYNLYSLYPNLYRKLSNTSLLDRIIMFTKDDTTDAGKGLQGKPFSEISWADDFYSQLLEQVHQDFGDIKKIMSMYKNRGKTKYHCMLLFFDPAINGGNSYRVPFKKYFPRELRLMDMIRSTKGLPKMLGKKRIGNPKNNILPILLQRLEAKIILEEVCPAILKDHPDMFLLTIHDSIITVKGKEHIVRDYMERILYQRTGSKPGLTVENLTPFEQEANFQKFINDEWEHMYKSLKIRARENNGQKEAQGNIKAMLEKMNMLGTIPLLLQIPTQFDKQILSTRYVQNNDFDDFMLEN